LRHRIQCGGQEDGLHNSSYVPFRTHHIQELAPTTQLEKLASGQGIKFRYLLGCLTPGVADTPKTKQTFLEPAATG
jgi:hypothetical protein